MRSVIGLEGFVPANADVVWGAAALRDGEVLINSHTKISAPLTEAARLASERHLHLFDPIDLRQEHEDLPLVVVMVNRNSDKRDTFLIDTGKIGGLVDHRHAGGWQYYVFADSRAFNRYARDVGNAIISSVLYSDVPQSDRNRDLVRNALILAPGSASLNALRVYLSENSGHLERLARASIRPDWAVPEFELLLSALRSAKDEYELKYEEGAAAGGGFDVDVAAATLNAIQLANREFKPALQRQYPFIKDVPSPRFKEMKAASAELHFVASVPNRPLGDRVARYLSLHFLEETLRGERPAGVQQTRDLQQALKRITHPSPETRLSQKRLTKDDREEVTYVPPPKPSVQRSDVLKVLGVITGLERDTFAEISIAPGWRLSVSTVDNGDREAPIGAEAMRGAAFFRKPFICSLVRENRADGTERFNLLELRALRAGVIDDLTAIPSSVMPEAFMVNVGLKIEASDDQTIRISQFGVFSEVAHGTWASANAFLKSYGQSRQTFELANYNAAGISWLQPERPQVTAIGRVLVALSELGGEALVNDVVATINRLFNPPASVRVNNTRREVIRHPDLVEFLPDDGSVMRWTPVGQAFYQVYVAAGGPTAEL